MITAVDTNVLLDVFTADQRFGPGSATSLRVCLTEGKVIACSIVWAETAAHFADESAFRNAMDQLGIGYSEVTQAASILAGQAWRSFRRAGGSRNRVMADFLIAAHAELSSSRLLTRDRGFYRQHFPNLTVLDPTGHA